MGEFFSSQDLKPVGLNTEGFTADDYLQTPSFSTAIWEYEESGAALPEEIVYENTPILNQGPTGACSVFGITKAVNEADFFDSKTILDAMQLWNEWVAEGRIPNGWEDGWTMSGALKLMKDKGYISWWYFCKTPEDIAKALLNKNICYSGTNRCNWRETKKTHYFTPDKPDMRSGHLYCINGIFFNKGVLKNANSWGERWADKGHFYTKFSDIDKMYTIVAIIDKKSNRSSELEEDTKDSQKTVEKGIWNGQSPDENLEKLHAVFMVMRAFKKNFDNNSALEQAMREGIVKYVNWTLTRRDFLTMVFRCAWGKTTREDLIPPVFEQFGIIRNQNWLDEPIKRYHASLIVARMLKNLGEL